MKRILIILLFILSSALLFAESKIAGYKNGVWFADFEKDIILDFGSWNKDAQDMDAKCEISFIKDVRDGKTGFFLRLKYDVESDKPAYNGFWIKLKNSDFNKYETISFSIKGDKGYGYTKKIKLELKNEKGEVGVTYLTDIADTWMKMKIPLRDFDGLSEFSKMTEFVIVFEDKVSDPKTGTIYIDDIYAGEPEPVYENMTKMAAEIGVDIDNTERGLVINMKKAVSFEPGSSMLSSDSITALEKLVPVILEHSPKNISIEGHTDSTGNAENNKSLSLNRAQSVAVYFVSKGITKERIKVNGLGSENPIDTNDTPAGRERNRRVEIIIDK